jgi:hypothetical protein
MVSEQKQKLDKQTDQQKQKTSMIMHDHQKQNKDTKCDVQSSPACTVKLTDYNKKYGLDGQL